MYGFDYCIILPLPSTQHSLLHFGLASCLLLRLDSSSLSCTNSISMFFFTTFHIIDIMLSLLLFIVAILTLALRFCPVFWHSSAGLKDCTKGEMPWVISLISLGPYFLPNYSFISCTFFQSKPMSSNEFNSGYAAQPCEMCCESNRL